VAKNDYPYPPDEFDRVDLGSRPKEVHAARRGPWSRAWPFLLVIVLIPAIAFAVVYFLGNRLPGGGSGSGPTGGAVQSSSPAASDQPTDATLTAEPTEPTPTEEPTVAQVDKALKVTIYNDGLPDGTARRSAEDLKAAGYLDAASHDTPNPAAPALATVYYQLESQAATAQDIATTLQATRTELNGEALAVELNPEVVSADGTGASIVVIVK
jgi:hypothetical protein